MPSPVPDRPGLLIRDPFRYTDATVIVPPPLVECLECFDGVQTDLDLRSVLVRITGDLQVGDLERRLIETLSASGFLDDNVFAKIQEARRTEFADAARREAVHAGAAYPDEVEELADLMNAYMGSPADPSADGICAIAAPHVSPEGGWQSYRAAYKALAPRYKERTFVVLGTSHYGEPERFGLTRKPFVTPFGETQVDLPLVNELADRAPGSVNMEDYCHAVEHSIEFQVVFLQHLYGPGIRILPILCGSYARSIYGGGKPEDDERVRQFLDVLGDVAERESGRLFWILGIDMAHMGRRYGDPFSAIAERNEMAEVAERDRDRIGRMIAGDADGFWELVRENRDDLKWCGSSPVYTFMKAQPQCTGTLLRYEQWNIDAQSVVSFAGMSFARKA